MDYTATILTTTPEVEEFLAEWRSSKPYVEAQTSGSTGTPKPIRLLKSDMRCSAASTCTEFGLNSSSLVALPLAASYIAGKMMIVRALEAGCRLCAEPPSRHELLRSVPEGETVDLVAIVPAQIEGLLSVDHCRVRLALVGGAPVSLIDEERMLASGIEAFATYGMTETCSNVALRPFGSDVYVANPGISFGIDQRGCLAVESKKMSFRRIVTNDLVELLNPTRFRWLGRVDNVINSGGVKIYAEFVERKIAQIVPSERFYVTSRPSKLWGQEVIAVVEREYLPDSRDIIRLKAILSPAENPKEWIAVENLPRTSTGKIFRRNPEDLRKG